MSRPVVVVMCKAPRAGEVKTRLNPFLSAAHAAALASCMFQDAVHNAARAAREVLVAYTPGDGRASLEGLLSAVDLQTARIQFFEQRGADLGERLEAAAALAFARGFAPVVITGTDTHIPPALIASAMHALSEGEADLALGPADDGGYYLVGLRHPTPGLFLDVAWSTEFAYRQTADNAARQSLRLLEGLPRLSDVDTSDDFKRLRLELLEDPERALLLAPSTYRWLEKKECSEQ
jgi:rSAM/selenodomain-associated transferase 1